MKNRLQTQRRILRDLEEYGRSGRYREVFRAYLTTQGLEPPLRAAISTTESLIQLQYAIALQHAGLFEIALKNYQHVANEILTAKRIRQDAAITPADLLYNAKVQQAVLLERLGQPRDALSILNELGLPSSYHDARLAMASLPSWIDITRLKCALSLRDRKTIRTLTRRCINDGDWNQKLWGRLFLALLPLVDAKMRSRGQLSTIVNDIEVILTEMDSADPPATSWLALIAGQEIARRSPLMAEALLRSAHQKATAWGRAFVIAAVCEQLSACYIRLRRRDESSRMLRRALSAYARCGLLMLEPFTRRLFSAASKLWGQASAADILLRSAHLQEPREEQIFSQMCKLHARQRGCRPDEIFEEFVRDWALSRYVGKYRHVEPGRETADVLLAHKGKGTFVQAKHVAVPVKHIPERLYFRKLAEIYNVQVERYVFVVTTSSSTGWRESLWHAQYTERVRQLIPDPKISVEVVLEPELQMDVVLDDELFDKYFHIIHGSTRLHSRPRRARS